MRLIPKDEAGSTPAFTVRIKNDSKNELGPSLPRPEGKEGVPAKSRCKLEPGANLAVEVEFRRQDKVIDGGTGVTSGERGAVESTGRFLLEMFSCLLCRYWRAGG